MVEPPHVLLKVLPEGQQRLLHFTLELLKTEETEMIKDQAAPPSPAAHSWSPWKPLRPSSFLWDVGADPPDVKMVASDHRNLSSKREDVNLFMKNHEDAKLALRGVRGVALNSSPCHLLLLQVKHLLQVQGLMASRVQGRPPPRIYLETRLK